MNISNKGLSLIKEFEGLRLNAYLCSAGVPTIGYGSTFYPNGGKVKMGDKLNDEKEAEFLLHKTVERFENGVNRLLDKTSVTQSQFDALVSFAFNLGLGNLEKSTLLRKVKTNPNDPSIADEFLRWNKAGGKVLAGLTRRREAEAKLYFANQK